MKEPVANIHIESGVNCATLTRVPPDGRGEAGTQGAVDAWDGSASITTAAIALDRGVRARGAAEDPRRE